MRDFRCDFGGVRRIAQRQHDLDLGAQALGQRVNVDAPPLGRNALPHAEQTVRLGLVELVARQADAVVDDFEPHALIVAREGHAHLCCACILARVRERLLRHTEQYDRGGLGQREILFRQIEIELPVLLVGSLFGKRAQRRDKPEIDQHRRSQVLDDAAFDLDAGVEVALGTRQFLGDHRIGVAQFVMCPRHVHLARGENGAEFVVQFAREPCLLVLAHVLQVGRQLVELFGALAHEPIQMGLLLVQLIARKLFLPHLLAQ